MGLFIVGGNKPAIENGTVLEGICDPISPWTMVFTMTTNFVIPMIIPCRFLQLKLIMSIPPFMQCIWDKTGTWSATHDIMFYLVE
jgi:Na+-translocating ferredoxin:NAD+ oxidoreductase RnfE subunit